MKLSKYIDHTILKPEATEEEILKIVNEAKENDFFSVCVNSCWVKFVSTHLKNTNVKTCSVVGFPLGAMSIESKIFEAEKAIKDGANEIDMVINIGKLKSGNFDYVQEEITLIKKAIGTNILKVIIETCLLSEEEIKKVCTFVVKAKADFVKTSTGFSHQGATIENVKLMLACVNNKSLVKASGGIKTPKEFKHYLQLGVKRIGTSRGIELIKE